MIDEQADRVDALFQKKSKGFRAALYGLAGLVSIFFVLVFYPYVSFRGEQYRLEAEVLELGEQDSALKARRDEVRLLARDLGELSPTVANRFAELRWTDLEREAAAQTKRFESLRATLADPPGRPRETACSRASRY